jgi:hypothetical protein
MQAAMEILLAVAAVVVAFALPTPEDIHGLAQVILSMLIMGAVEWGFGCEGSRKGCAQ